MLLILFMLLKFELTVKLMEFDDVIIVKTTKTCNCPYLGNDMTVIWYLEIIVIGNFKFSLSSK